jgi:hypothetical protein
MKKLIIAAMALTCATAVFSADTVTSENIVGYNKLKSTAGLQMGGVQFLNNDGNSIESIFGDQYPLGTKIFVYEEGVGYKGVTYKTIYPSPSYQATNVWSGVVTNALPSVGFWVQMPDAAAAVTNVIAGDVPLSDAVTNAVVNGLNLFSYPYPVAVEVQNLGFTPSLGDQVFVYINGTGYVGSLYKITYPAPDYTPVIAWSNPTLEIPVGSGFWYQTTNTTTWIAVKPF